jgi:hypothetical protein
MAELHWKECSLVKNARLYVKVISLMVEASLALAWPRQA